LARSWYSRAVEIDPKQDAAVNNLAYLTAHSDPVDLDVALQLANQAVELDPDNSHYRETRGQILILLQQWQAAIDDLTKAVNGMPTKWQIHESLSTAYAKTGNPTLAKAHAEQFRRLRASDKVE
ncbi:MAG: hypothetical protein KDB23_11300, partial [Planctomycetales bacterium]|nr:hypothetical protein [Planctomycetales bacterium]